MVKGGELVKKTRILSILAITLLLLQIFSPNFGIVADAKSAKSDSEGKIKVTQLNQTDDSIHWRVTINDSGEENEGTTTKVRLSSGHTHDSVKGGNGAKIDKTADGYTVETPEGNTTYTIDINTTIQNPTQTSFSLQAETNYGNKSYKASDEVEVEVKQPEKIVETKDEKNAETSEKTKEEKTTEEKVEQDEKQNEQAEEEKELEDEYIPVEQYGNQPGGKAKAFSLNKFRAMSAGVGEGKATHKIEKTTSDNMCIRELDGEINFNLPKPEVKTPVDIVVVQDASGSYGGNATQAKQSLKDIVDMLDLSQDRMMVTSYRGYNGWNSYNDLNAFQNKNVRSTKGINRNEQSLTLTNHTGLSNNATALKSGINQITFDGATPTASGLQYAKEQYEAATAGQDLSGRKTVFILITDGVANAQLDGRIHIEHNGGGIFNPHTWAESYQFYQPTFAEVVSVANTIKAKNYTMVSAYWENVTTLRNSYGTNYYNNTIGPAARQMVKDVASAPEYYSSNEDLAESISELLENLQSVLNEYNGFQTEFDIAPGFELVADSIEVNGNQADYTISGNTVTVTANKIKSGESTITYKLKETSVHGSVTTPISNGTIKYDKESNSFNGSVTVPNVTLEGNENSVNCIDNITKGVTLGDSNNFTENIDLEQLGDVFTYKIDYQFGANIGQYNQVQLKDELEPVLRLLNDIQISSNVDPHVLVQHTILNNQAGFIVDIQMKNGSFDYLAGKTVTVTFEAKIRDGVTQDDLKEYFETGIPNVAQLLLDGEPDESNEVNVHVPKLGSLTVNKVDENGEPLPGAEFKLNGPNGFEQTGTSDVDGVITFDDLEWGTYTLVETKAPEGYRLLTNEISVEIKSDDLHITKTVENTKQDWTIPKTGGIGTLGFYGAGLIIMAGAASFLFRRRHV